MGRTKDKKTRRQEWIVFLGNHRDKDGREQEDKKYDWINSIIYIYIYIYIFFEYSNLNWIKMVD